MLSQKEIDRIAAKLKGLNSCVGCKFLYTQDRGYSNYTVGETSVLCAKDRNKVLNDGDSSAPYDWQYDIDTGEDNWSKTNNSRCELWDGPTRIWVALDVDGECTRDDIFNDAFDVEAAEAICEHSGRG